MVVQNINHSKCVKCFKCYKLCPMDVFVLEEDTVNIKYREDCQSCYLCVYECPSHAIKVSPERSGKIFDVYDQNIGKGDFD